MKADAEAVKTAEKDSVGTHPVVLDLALNFCVFQFEVLRNPARKMAHGIDKVVDVPVLMQRHVPTIQTVQKTVEVPHVQFLDRVVDVPVVMQRQAPWPSILEERTNSSAHRWRDH